VLRTQIARESISLHSSKNYVDPSIIPVCELVSPQTVILSAAVFQA
jgi:hypothetical protein